MPLSSALFLPLVLFVSVVTFEFSLADAVSYQTTTYTPEVSSAPWLEKSCDSDGDCPDGIHATCFEGKCLCTPGYYYSNGQVVCVDSCPVADQQGEFLLYPNSGIREYSIGLVPTADTVEECLAACAADSNCPTVEFAVPVKKCYPNSITPLQDPDAYESALPSGFINLYQKRCA